MKRRNIICSVLFILLCNNLHCQLPDSLINYYNHINKAELAIVDSNYSLALKNYQDAFRYSKVPFKKDVYNETICSALLNNYSKSYNNFKELLNYGYHIDSLINKVELNGFFVSKYGKKLKKYAKKDIKLYNTELREKYDSLFIADQFFRLKKGSYAVYGDTIEKIDNSNVHIIKGLISQYGFPSQKLVGLYPDFNYNSILIMIIHNQVGNRHGQYFNFTEILYDALYQGELDSRIAFQLIAGSTGVDTYGYFISGVVKHGLDTNNNKDNKDVKLSAWGFYRLKKEEEQECDEKRKDIGLCTLQELRIKTIFNLKDNRFLITNQGGKRIHYWLYEKDYQKAINNLIIIE